MTIPASGAQLCDVGVPSLRRFVHNGAQRRLVHNRIEPQFVHERVEPRFVRNGAEDRFVDSGAVLESQRRLTPRPRGRRFAPAPPAHASRRLRA
jgi:hypothetical protein